MTSDQAYLSGCAVYDFTALAAAPSGSVKYINIINVLQ
jgi:hypothetical protein